MMMVIRLFGAFLLPALLSACGSGSQSDVQEWMDGVKKETHVNVPKLSEPKVFVPVAYAGKNEIDPFDPDKLLVVFARMKSSNKGLVPNKDRQPEVLESFPLDAIKMVGTIEKPGTKYALVQVDKTIFQVKVGNYMGQSLGRVVKLTQSEIDLKETVQDATGEWIEREAKLELQETTK